MDITQGLILGLIQGLTEFLPVSSTGHLILAREFLGVTEHGLAVDAVLQLATALAVFIYFARDIWSLMRGSLKGESKALTLGGALILGTIPAVILGVLLEDLMETSFRSASLVASSLIAGSIIFYLAEHFATKNRDINLRKGFGIGLFQALALIPGMSRSGMTIAGGLFLGLTREDAARFGFLLSFPIICGSGLKKLFDLFSAGVLQIEGAAIFAGAVVSFLSGLLAIHLMIRFVRTHSLMPFIVYRLVLAGAVLLFL